ncbi:MAG: NAD kinase [Bifidobacteriaceae bacterium]|jgi:NAD+ kinase|nr:NAD kinase [Bifidobacteriaceae bacterium]
MKRVLIMAHMAETDVEAAQATARARFERADWEVTTPERHRGEPLDLVLVLGGDGTLLRAAELVHGQGTALLGVNLGHLGFLAECEAGELPTAIDRVVAGDYRVEPRATLSVTVTQPDGDVWRGWALNEVTLEKVVPQRMVEVILSVDGQDLSAFGCDGLVISTATGSTGHAFSGGGPVVWPDMAVLLVVPLAAHALFGRPLLVTPDSTVAVEVARGAPGARSNALASCDGRRTAPMGAGGRMEVTAGDRPVNLVRFGGQPFSERLVRKFDLPVRSWRGQSAARGV